MHAHLQGPNNLLFTHKGSYMSAQVSLNLLNELGKKIKCGLAEHFIRFSQRV